MADGDRRRIRAPRWVRRLKNVGRGAQNAVELLRGGRFTAPYRASFDIVHETHVFRLRHYRADRSPIAGVGSILFVPPLMVTSEVYDISPELSAVAWLGERGLDVWLVDYGKPESEDQGMERTLDDHVLAVDASVDIVREATGNDVHLAGYSQGGMFVYQCAAYRAGEGLASLITFGSPVDIHRNIPAVRDDIAGRLIRGATEAVKKPLDRIDGLPGTLTSTGFRMFSARKELQQFVELFGILHDRSALAKREKRRRFIAGEGFVAWPGPALRTFVDEFIANNRMTGGGFVIGGRTVTLATLRVPILCFVGARDEMARPASVRAIRDAAPEAQIHEVVVPAGHFGLVVGSRSLAVTWPTVAEWMRWLDVGDDRPVYLTEAAPKLVPEHDEPEEAPFEDVDVGVEFFYDMATDAMDQLWGRLGDMSREVGDTLDVLRWQLPRIAQLKRLGEDTRISVARVLAEQARAIPDETFFLWQGRAFTYAQADERVTNVAKGLWSLGIRPGDRVGVLMSNRPTYLSIVAAASRIGAVSVLFHADARGRSLEHAVGAARPAVLLADPEHAAIAQAAFGSGTVQVLGGGTTRELGPDVVDMEAIDVGAVEFPDDLVLDAGLGGDLAMLVFTAGTTGLPAATRITNRRWGLAALGTAAGCRLTSGDTVYCCLPLHHASAMLIAVGGGLVGGARIALAPQFAVSSFWEDVRRYGATVVFYVGEMCRHLTNEPVRAGEDRSSVRIFAGTGMRADVWRRLLERFNPDRVVEFYAATEGNATLVNFSGRKIGSVGRELPGSPPHVLVRFDRTTGEPLIDEDGRRIRCDDDEPGILLSRVLEDDPIGELDGYADRAATEARLLHDVFEAGDTWFASGDVLRRDVDGDFFLDRLGDSFHWKGEVVSTELVANVLRELPGVEFVAVYGVPLSRREGRAGCAALQLRDGARFDARATFAAVTDNLPPAARPVFVRVVETLEMTASFKVVKEGLCSEGAHPRTLEGPIFWYDEQAGAYAPLDIAAYETLGG